MEICGLLSYVVPFSFRVLEVSPQQSTLLWDTEEADVGQIGVLTFKNSVAFLASQLCRMRQEEMSFAKMESWVDAGS